MLGNDLDRAVVLDVHDAAAHGLPVGEINENVVTWPPAWLWLVHVDSMRPQRSLVQPARLRRLTRALVVQLSD